MQTHSDTVYRFDQFEVNPASGELFRNGKRVKLQEQPFRLLVVLLENAGEVVSHEELRSRIWPGDTFVDFDGSLRVAVRKLRDALGDQAERPRYIETVPKHGYRFLDSAVRPAETIAPATPPQNEATEKHPAYSTRWALAAAALVILAGAAVWLLPHRHRKVLALTEKDTVVLADFVNTTGDPVFDGTLRQGLAVDLEQSPFLSLVSDERIQQTLPLMGQPPDARLSPQVAHDLCQRTQSAAYLTGSIADLGSQYVIGLKAVSCATGDVLDEEQQTAGSKEKILGTLDQEARRLREKLGESLSTVQKFNTPLEQATTPTFEAFQAYTLGRREMVGRDEFAASVPFFQRAIRFDPNFAIAYATLGSVYATLGQSALSIEYATKAYDLHAPVSEPERFYIETTYYHYVVGDLDKARQVYQTYAQVYPRSSHPPIRLFVLYEQEGKYEDAVTQIRKALRLDPWKGGVIFSDLVSGLIDLDRLQEAGSTAQQAISNGLDSTGLRFDLYQLAFLENDAQGMARQVEWARDKPDAETGMLEFEAWTAAYFGKLNESRSLSRQAEESATRAGDGGSAARYEAYEALNEALFEKPALASRHNEPAHNVLLDRSAQYATALNFALAGDSSRAQSLSDDLARRYPEDTLVQLNFLPSVRAQIALDHNDPSKAIDLLQPARQYEMSGVLGGFMGPVYIRGEAYLMEHKGAEAATEFQKILDHRGVVANSPSGALAYLQLGRAYAMTGDENKAKAAYQEFLTLWKDADPDIPVLNQAKAEYTKLR